MILNKSKFRKLYCRTARLRFIGTSILTATVIFLLTSEFPTSKAMACLPTLNTGFFCAAVTKVTAQSPFNGTNATGIQSVFLAINLLIATRILWKGYQAWSAREAGEEYQSTVNGLIIGLVILFVLESVANRVVGAV